MEKSLNVAQGDLVIVDEILDMLRKYTKQPGESWTEDTTMAEAQVDSFDLVELVFNAEEKYGIEIAFNSNESISPETTVGQIARLVSQAIAAAKQRA